MLISLLSRVLQSQRGRGSGILSRRGVQSAGQELADRAAGAGADLPRGGDLPGGVVPSGPVGPGGTGGVPSPQPAQPQVQGRVQGQPTPQQPPGPSEGERQFRGHIANMVRRAAGGEIPNGAAGWIREVTKDAGSRTAGERGKTGFVGRMLGLDQVPGLTKAQSKTLKKQGLITAGLAMMGSPRSASFSQTLAAGIFSARSDTAETVGQLMDVQRAEQQLQQRQKILNNPDLGPIETWESVRESALASGDTELAGLATDVIGQYNDMSASELNAELVDVNGDGVKEEVIRGEDGSLTVRDPYTKDVIEQRPAQPVDPNQPIERTRVDPETGREFTFLADPVTGQPVAGSEIMSGVGAGAGGQVDPEKAQVATTLQRELTNIRNILGDDPETEEIEGAERFDITGSFGRLARFLPAELEPSDLKQMKAASENILSLIVRQRSGAQATNAEVERLKSFAIPKPGDDPETIRTKLERMQAIVDDFSNSGGNANAAVDPIMQDDGRSEQDILDEVYGGN